MTREWMKSDTLKRTKAYVCGYCSVLVGPEKGYMSTIASDYLAICPHCSCPTYVGLHRQTPGAPFGNAVSGLPGDVEAMYSEVRDCMKVSAYTAAVLACRKILMHIGVEKEADEGKPFAYYVEYLDEKHYFPPGGKDWVDCIRTVGNIANHEIKIMSADDAKALITFVEMLLKFIYEYPNKVPNP